MKAFAQIRCPVCHHAPEHTLNPESDLPHILKCARGCSEARGRTETQAHIHWAILIRDLMRHPKELRTPAMSRHGGAIFRALHDCGKDEL